MGPVGPVGPVEPVGPVGPVLPVGPVGPVANVTGANPPMASISNHARLLAVLEMLVNPLYEDIRKNTTETTVGVNIHSFVPIYSAMFVIPKVSY